MSLMNSPNEVKTDAQGRVAAAPRVVAPGAAPRATPAAPTQPVAPKSVATKPVASKPAAYDPEEDRRLEKAGGLVMSARLALRRGKKSEARSLLQQVFVISPTDCSALELLGDMFMEDAEQQKAIEVYQRGRKYHPQHRAFEEKLALAHVDLAEMERDRIAREMLLEHGDRDKWLDLQPNKAFGLSLLLPGAGQVYVGHLERAVAFFVAAIGSFCAWFIPFTTALKGARIAGKTDLGSGINYVFANLGGAAKFVLMTLFLVWIATYIASAFDAMRSVQRANAERRHTLGL